MALIEGTCDNCGAVGWIGALNSICKQCDKENTDKEREIQPKLF